MALVLTPRSDTSHLHQPVSFESRNIETTNNRVIVATEERFEHSPVLCIYKQSKYNFHEVVYFKIQCMELNPTETN
jgi:hypothetical protein